ncbi:MAG: hypothetical protein IIY78_08845, partial [Clostridia bacterium]|nr:hypothetical protein [Clostridia bacterium]
MRIIEVGGGQFNVVQFCHVSNDVVISQLAIFENRVFAENRGRCGCFDCQIVKNRIIRKTEGAVKVSDCHIFSDGVQTGKIGGNLQTDIGEVHVIANSRYFVAL